MLLRIRMMCTRLLCSIITVSSGRPPMSGHRMRSIEFRWATGIVQAFELLEHPSHSSQPEEQEQNPEQEHQGPPEPVIPHNKSRDHQRDPCDYLIDAGTVHSMRSLPGL